MHNKYNEKISDMKKCIQKKNKLNLLLKQTEQDIIKEKLLLNKLSLELNKENQDVLKLKSNNIISLFLLNFIKSEIKLSSTALPFVIIICILG